MKTINSISNFQKQETKMSELPEIGLDTPKARDRVKPEFEKMDNAVHQSSHKGLEV